MHVLLLHVFVGRVLVGVWCLLFVRCCVCCSLMYVCCVLLDVCCVLLGVCSVWCVAGCVCCLLWSV